MSQLFVTGDTHCGYDMSKLNSRHFKAAGLTKDDIVVIMGDAGLVWSGGKEEEFWQNFLNKKPWTTFCVLGNHENYNKINLLPKVEFAGGICRQVSDTIFYAQTGEIYNLCGNKCLVVNGADSVDRGYRQENVDWWAQEAITDADVNKTLDALAAVGGEVDYVFSHTGGTAIANHLGFKGTQSDVLLDKVLEKAMYKDHYCGHYHVDKVTPYGRILYDDVIPLNRKFDFF